jgi:hypothetical protein
VDDAVLRNRRARRHKRGDHSLCRPDRCPDARLARAELPAAVGAVDAPDAGPVEAAVAAWQVELAPRPGDPRAIMLAAAMRLARAVDAGDRLDACARELRLVVGHLADVEAPPDFVDRLRARQAARRVELVLGPEGRAG